MANDSSAPLREETPHVNNTSRTTITNAGKGDTSQDKIQALTEIICGAGDGPAAALLVLMATLEKAAHPEALVNTAKHLAFTRCGELNVGHMVDAQIAVLEGELLA